MTTITQTITTLPTAPDPATMTPTEFSAAAAAYVLAQKAMVPELNTWAGQVNTVGGEVNSNATSTAANAAVAAGIANYAEAYSSLSGAKTVPLSCDYLGAFWILVSNSADITADVPGVSAKWAKAYGTPVITERTTNVKLISEDNGKIVKVTAGTFSQTFDACATLGAGWMVYLINSGTGVITLDPDGAELIDGASTKILPKDAVLMVQCTGTALQTVTFASTMQDNHVTVTTGNGYGSTNTKIRRFTTTLSSAGNALTYADSAANGGSITVNEAGLYEIFIQDAGLSATTIYFFGASLNSNQLTTDIPDITAAHRIMFATVYNRAGGSTFANAASRIMRLAVGDVIRMHNKLSLPDSTNAADTVLSVRKVGIV